MKRRTHDERVLLMHGCHHRGAASSPACDQLANRFRSRDYRYPGCGIFSEVVFLFLMCPKHVFIVDVDGCQSMDSGDPSKDSGDLVKPIKNQNRRITLFY